MLHGIIMICAKKIFLLKILFVKFNFEKQFIKFLIQAENDSKYFEFTTNKLIRSMNCNNNLIKSQSTITRY